MSYEGQKQTYNAFRAQRNASLERMYMFPSLMDLGEAPTGMNDFSHDLHKWIEGGSSKCCWCDIAVTLRENRIRILR
jgi:hypothetical protein